MLRLERSERTKLFTPFRAEFLSTVDSQKGTTGVEGSGKAPEPIVFWNKSQDGVRVMKKVSTEARKCDSDDCLCSLQTLNKFWLSNGKTE